jgi:RNA polymerase sigma-70 factor (ECF subfamily)
MERIALTDEDVARIESLENVEAGTLIDVLVPDQRFAVQAHVVEERDYAEIAQDLNVSEAVVRKRVSRGLAALRHRMGADHDR